jgi:hypothetical protein
MTKLPLSEQMIKMLSARTLSVIATDLNRAQYIRVLSEDESVLYEACLAELDQRGQL